MAVWLKQKKKLLSLQNSFIYLLIYLYNTFFFLPHSLQLHLVSFILLFIHLYVLTLPQMFPEMSKPTEICMFIDFNSPFYFGCSELFHILFMHNSHQANANGNKTKFYQYISRITLARVSVGKQLALTITNKNFMQYMSVNFYVTGLETG